MSNSGSFLIELDRPFDHLPLAPVVEAVIQFRSRITGKWEPESLSKKLAEQLPQLQTLQLQQRIEFEALFDSELPSPKTSQRQICHAIRGKDAEGKVVAQFSRDGLIFSRLKPYPGWPVFLDEALRVWEVFQELTDATEIQRLGTRFINRIDGVEFATLGEFLREPPSLPRALPLKRFLYQSTFDVPGHDLAINVIKTMQPDEAGQSALIIDIDVSTTREIPCNRASLDQLLLAMRWLKNMVFFELLTAKVIDSFREPRP
jgi:uncharacterized protein (TIGR04255 family)